MVVQTLGEAEAGGPPGLQSLKGGNDSDKDVMYTGQFNSTSLLLSQLVSASDRKYSCCSFCMLVKPEKVHYGLWGRE